MNELAVTLHIRPIILLLGGELEEPQTSSGVQAETVKNGAEEVVGEREGQAFQGAEATEDQDAGDPVEELGSAEPGLFSGVPAGGRRRRVEGSDSTWVGGKEPS